MIPSVICSTPIGKVLVRWRREWFSKTDRSGRRIRGTSRPGPVLGLVVARHNAAAITVRDLWVDLQEFPASMNRHDAVKEYVNARTDLKA